MYVILLKDKYNGIYLCEQIEYYLALESAMLAQREYAKSNRDSRYDVIRVNLIPESYKEYQEQTNKIIYEGDLYTDIDKCLLSGDYEIVI